MKKKDATKTQSYRVGDHKLLSVFTTENEANPVFQIEQFYTDAVLPTVGEKINKPLVGSKLAMQFTASEMRVLLNTGIEWLKTLIKDGKL